MLPAVFPADPVPTGLQNAWNSLQQKPLRVPLLLMANSVTPNAEPSDNMQVPAHGPRLAQPTWTQL